LRVILVDVVAVKAVGAARVVLVRLVPRVAIWVDAPALAIARVGADRDRVAAAVVLGVGSIGGALETRHAARGARPALAAALLVGECTCGVRWVEDALAVVLIFILAHERRRAARLVMVFGCPGARGLMMVHPAALAVHGVEAQVLRLALAVIVVHKRAVVIARAATLACEAFASALIKLLVATVAECERGRSDDESYEAVHAAGPSAIP